MSVTEYRSPTGDSSPLQFTPSSGTTHWNLVDDPPATPDDADYVSRADSNGRDAYTFSAFTISDAVTVNNVTAFIRCKSAAGSAKGKTSITVSGTEYQGSNVGSASFADYTTVYTQNPATLAAWTLSEVKALTVFGCRAALTTGYTLQVSQLYLSCNYDNTRTISITDTGSGADADPGINATISATDTGSGADADPGINATISATDSGSGVDEVQIAASISISDIGGDADEISIAVSVGVLDALLGDDELAEIGNNVVVTDSSGAVFSTIDVNAAGFVGIQDRTVGDDSYHEISVGTHLTDTGAGVDSVTVDKTFALGTNIWGIYKNDALIAQSEISLDINDTGNKRNFIKKFLVKLQAGDVITIKGYNQHGVLTVHRLNISVKGVPGNV